MQPDRSSDRGAGLRGAFASLLRDVTSPLRSHRRVDIQEEEFGESSSRTVTPPLGTRIPNLIIPKSSILERDSQIVVGVLLRYVSFQWRPRLFVLQDGVFKYYKLYGPTAINVHALLEAFRQQGDVFTIGAEVGLLEAQHQRENGRNVGEGGDGGRQPDDPAHDGLHSPTQSQWLKIPSPNAEVHMQVGTVRESRSDRRKFHVHTGTSTITLRAETPDDRWVWVEALRSAKGAWDGLTPPAAGALRKMSLTEDTKDLEYAQMIRQTQQQLVALGATEEIVNYVMTLMGSWREERTNIVTDEELKRQALLQVVYRLENEKRQLETALVIEGSRTATESTEVERLGGPRRGTPSIAESGESPLERDSIEEYGENGGGEEDGESTSSDDAFFECETTLAGVRERPLSRNGSALEMTAVQNLPECSTSVISISPNGESTSLPALTKTAIMRPAEKSTLATTSVQLPHWLTAEGPDPPRRTRLPTPRQPEKRVSLWSLIKEMVGRDLTRVCLPVYFNEPLSALQKTAEDLEYSELLDQAATKAPKSIERLLLVAAFAVSAYSSTVDRTAKPFNPLLGETYELVHVEKGFRFLAEKVSHHPTIIAAVAEGRQWRFEGDAEVKSKFWGRSIELKPEGVLRLSFADGDVYTWNKVTTYINNLILGKIYVDHGGIMKVRCVSCPRGLTAKIRFKETSALFDRDPRQVRGFIEKDGRSLERPLMVGHWDDSVWAELEDGGTVELWRKAPPPPEPTRYNLTAFAIQLNELTPGLKEQLAPTDCRLRPDQAATERGLWDVANMEKQRLEHKQRAARRAADAGEPLRPRWFNVLADPSRPRGTAVGSVPRRPGAHGPAFSYKGGYWEARAGGRWEGCRDIFGQTTEP